MPIPHVGHGLVSCRINAVEAILSGVAFVGSIPGPTFDLAAFWTRPLVTQTAFPLGTEESGTIRVGAGAGKYGAVLAVGVSAYLVSLIA